MFSYRADNLKANLGGMSLDFTCVADAMSQAGHVLS
jgi:hypothetical protein